MGDPASMSVLSLVATASVVILLAGSTLSFTGMIDQANYKTQEQWVVDEVKPRVKDVCTSSKEELPPDRALTQKFSGDSLEIGSRGTSNNHVDDTYTLIMKDDGKIEFNVELVKQDDCDDTLSVTVQGSLPAEKNVKIKEDGDGAQIELT